jgi:chorismate mutase/prephenate dehydrogenase
MTTPETLQRARAALAQVDRELLELVAKRLELASTIGQAKRELGLPTRDFAQERDVIERARQVAEVLRIPASLAEGVLQPLIMASLSQQERDGLIAAGTGSGRSALVIGGSGRMGGWFVRFLASQGFEVEVADPVAGAARHRWIPDWHASSLDHDLIVVAAPLERTAAILEELALRRPRGLVFDVGSLKTPLKRGLTALAAAGVRITSIHPMFGPDTDLLSGRHVIFIDCGAAPAVEEARALFAPTMATQVAMTVEEHDRLIAYVLGLSHAANIAFFSALETSGEAAPALDQMSSTTFNAQVAIASRVAEENPHLYFEIQALNQYGLHSLAALKGAVDAVYRAVAERDEAAFVRLMERGRAYFREGTRRT